MFSFSSLFTYRLTTDSILSVYMYAKTFVSRTWNPITSPWMKQLTWLKIVHSGDWCLRLALHTPGGAGACMFSFLILKMVFSIDFLLEFDPFNTWFTCFLSYVCVYHTLLTSAAVDGRRWWSTPKNSTTFIGQWGEALWIFIQSAAEVCHQCYKTLKTSGLQ